MAARPALGHLERQRTRDLRAVAAAAGRPHQHAKYRAGRVLPLPHAHAVVASGEPRRMGRPISIAFSPTRKAGRIDGRTVMTLPWFERQPYGWLTSWPIADASGKPAAQCARHCSDELSTDPQGRAMTKFAAQHLDPGSHMGEALFGLIMTLTFTLGADLVIQAQGREGARQMLIGILGCTWPGAASTARSTCSAVPSSVDGCAASVTKCVWRRVRTGPVNSWPPNWTSCSCPSPMHSSATRCTPRSCSA